MNRMQKTQVIVSVVVAATAGLIIYASQLIQTLLESRKTDNSDWGMAAIGLMIYLAMQAILYASVSGDD